MRRVLALIIGCIALIGAAGLAAHVTITRQYGSGGGLLHVFADRELAAWLILACGVLAAAVLVIWQLKGILK